MPIRRHTPRRRGAARRVSVSTMTRKPPSDIERLHHELFGIVPGKHGTAYERIAAVVMAVLGWHDVEYDRSEQPEGLLAGHQIDVVCRRPDGNQERLIIECKDVGKNKV